MYYRTELVMLCTYYQLRSVVEQGQSQILGLPNFYMGAGWNIVPLSFHLACRSYLVP